MAFHVYPVQCADEELCAYKVKINGVEADVNTARVSAMPFNRRWPGHQRPKDQSELVNFISLETDEELYFEITPPRPFERVDIRPGSLGIVPEIKDGVICFTLEKSAYFTVEPYGRNEAFHVFADGVSEFGVDKCGENVMYFGAGVHEVGDIELKSGDALFIDEGAVVYACVKAVDAENISIIGRGILDNSRNVEQILFEYNAVENDVAIKNAKRKHTIQLEYCKNIEISGITIRDSLVYNIRPIACENLHISDIKIIGCWRYNSDGIDMHNCVNVLIENCFIRTFDDSICVKGFDCYYSGDVEAAVRAAMYRNGKAYDVFKNVVVRNCVIWNDWGKCLEIGAETRAEEICDITFENCDLIHVTAAVLDCNNVDYADVHHITYRDINVEYDEIVPNLQLQRRDDDKFVISDHDYAPDLIAVITEFHHEYSAGGARRGKNRDILFKNIHLWGRQAPKMRFIGYDDAHRTENVTVENIYWNGRLLESIDDERVIRNEFTSNIIYRAVRD